MKRYSVLVTRTTTESCRLVVFANKRTDVEDYALAQLPLTEVTWELDDPGSQGDPFVSDVTEDAP